MSENEYIQSVYRANAWMADGKKAQLTPIAMERVLRDAYRAGREQGRTERPPGEGHDLFNRIFRR